MKKVSKVTKLGAVAAAALVVGQASSASAGTVGSFSKPNYAQGAIDVTLQNVQMGYTVSGNTGSMMVRYTSGGQNYTLFTAQFDLTGYSTTNGTTFTGAPSLTSLTMDPLTAGGHTFSTTSTQAVTDWGFTQVTSGTGGLAFRINGLVDGVVSTFAFNLNLIGITNTSGAALQYNKFTLLESARAFGTTNTADVFVTAPATPLPTAASASIVPAASLLLRRRNRKA